MGRYTSYDCGDGDRTAELDAKRRAKRKARQAALRAAGLDMKARPAVWPSATSNGTR